MRTKFIGRKIDITEGLKSYSEKRLKKLDKFFNEDTEVQFTLSVQKLSQTAEVTIFQNGMVYRAEDTSDDMYASIDRVIDLIERQIRKNKTRLEKKLRENAFVTIPEKDSPAEEKEFKIVKTKKHAIKPMSPEEAILQMNLLGHEFYIFINASTDETDVVYKRKDGNYGLIEAEDD